MSFDNEVLLTPGPTHIPERVFKAMHKPKLHHRTKVFEEFFVEASEGFRRLTKSKNWPVFISGSGTAAMEAALLNSCRKNDQIIVLNAGKFGERWIHIAHRLGLKVLELKAQCGESVALENIKETLVNSGDIRAVCMQFCETSTTVELPVKQICSMIKNYKPEVLTIVDAVSALGTTEIHFDKIAIDILAGAGHKGLMLPPGLAMLSLSDYAWQCVDEINTPSLYFDLKLERNAALKKTTAWTPAVNHIVGLCESLKMINEEGEANVYRRHLLFSKALQSAIRSMGLKLMTEAHPSAGVTGAYTPEKFNAERIREMMLNEFAVRIAGGQEELNGKVLRFGHMGYCSNTDIIKGINALEHSLLKLKLLHNEVHAADTASKILNEALK